MELEEVALRSCYLSLNQITPFIRFSHLKANQAILEAIGVGQQQGIHIIDFDIMHEVQWPPLMHALADLHPSPTLCIIGISHDLNTVYRTGDRLLKFAEYLGLRFHFHPNDDPTSLLITITLLPNESFVMNFILYLHRILEENLLFFLYKIKALNPKVVTVEERKSNHKDPVFLKRFVEAVKH